MHIASHFDRMKALLWTLAVLLCAAPAVAQTGVTAYGGPSAISRTTLGVVINTDDPLSVAIGEYYVTARRIPRENVIRVAFNANRSEMPVEEFMRVIAKVSAETPQGVQAYALAWTAPYRVGCMSMTTAFALGYDSKFCANGCQPTQASPYFNHDTRHPARDLRMRPAMLLAGRTFLDAKAMIDRGVAADGSAPRGAAYLLITADRDRNSRAPLYASVPAVALPRIEVKILRQDAIEDRNDVLFYFTGLPSVAKLETLTFLPGAIADHLTSAGGMLTDSMQMSALRWLEAGATASYGAVVEPCNYPQKFPHPAVVISRYLQGETLIEAYWKSVAWPGQGVFIGEPLAAPFHSLWR